jgi:signal transduction histidine kinase
VVVGLTCLWVAGLALRRLQPVAAPLLVVAAVVALGAIDDRNSQPTIPLALALAAFTLGHDARMPWAAAGASVALALMWAAQLAAGSSSSDLIGALLILAVPWASGRLLRRRAEHGDELLRDADRRREQAVREERERIARELHDVVSHSISVVSVQTQAVRRRLGPEQREEADQLRAVEATVRQAMGELRRLFGMLRAEGEEVPLAPQPGLAELDELLAETRAAGLKVEVLHEGRPEPLAPGVDLAAYRIVQEALTNVRRHAPGSPARILLRHRPDALEVQVDDDGAGARPVNGVAGHGLIGMRERVALYGGSFEAGPRPGGGFRVRARLPLREGPDA